jgi:hypothetical protein
MFFGPQKPWRTATFAHGRRELRYYSREKVIPLRTVKSPGAKATILKSCVLNHRAEILAAELFKELFRPANGPCTAFYAGFGRESFATFAGDFEV